MIAATYRQQRCYSYWQHEGAQNLDSQVISYSKLWTSYLLACQFWENKLTSELQLPLCE